LKDFKAASASIGLWLLLTGVGIALDLITRDSQGPKLIQLASTERLVLLDQSFRILIATLTLLIGIKISESTISVRNLLVALVIILVIVTFLKKVYLGYGINDYSAVPDVAFQSWALAQLLAILIFVSSTFLVKKGT
jgi:hypothetical protein